jgi:hypothetical protein
VSRIGRDQSDEQQDLKDRYEPVCGPIDTRCGSAIRRTIVRAMNSETTSAIGQRGSM